MTGVRRKKSKRRSTIKITKGMRKKPKKVDPSIGEYVTISTNWYIYIFIFYKSGRYNATLVDWIKFSYFRFFYKQLSPGVVELSNHESLVTRLLIKDYKIFQTWRNGFFSNDNMIFSLFSETLRQHWDKSKTLQENMKHLGLAYDSNTNAVGIEKRKKFSRKKVSMLSSLSLLSNLTLGFLYLFLYQKRICWHV